MNFILQQGKEIVFKVSDLFISNRSFMILIKVIMKHLRVFFIKNRLSKFGRLALHFILVNVDRVYDIVPIKRLGKKLNYLRTHKRCYMATKD